MQKRAVRDGLALLAMLAIVAIVGWTGSAVTLPKIPGWYAELAKPSFNPPPWVFGPVWTVLYLLMAVAAWRVWVRHGHPRRAAALSWYGVQLVLNAAWSQVFFGLERPGLAFLVILGLLVAVAGTMRWFWQVSRLAAWLLVPYLAWLMFAAVLNGAIVWLN